MTQTQTAEYGWLYSLISGERIRPATEEELKMSIQAAEEDGGFGVIIINDLQRCFVKDETVGYTDIF